ncbi:MAG: ABC transporter permease [Paludibacter sp.]|jgi:putative ABC transport system permease protein|nr:ABC transporter permease [Bacteroidales bacterium]HOG05616.1 ABC transporter permease [Paludibacter sp.]HOS46160.1 ABC transporter permease [Paludibacter sp.]HPM10277.1 ABC transporter permease [Paludibacter sp.]
MSFLDLDKFHEVWNTITSNKSRSVFTAFGVFWGMFMLVVLVGAGTALERGISSQIESFSTNSCFMWSQRTSLPYKGFRKGRNWDMKNEDIQLIQSTVPELQYIAPMIFSGSNTNNVTRNDKSGAYQIKGMTTDYALIDRPRQVLGRFINQVDVAEKRKVCVIGERVYEVLFPHGEDPIGKDIQVNGIYFQVVGVSGSYGNINVGGSAEESVVLPFSTMQQVFNMGNSIHIMALTAQPGVKVTVLEDKVKAVLKAANNIAPEDESAIGGMNIEEMFTMFLYLGIGIVSLMWVVGLGTLFAGAVGVSNIMLVTVRERTKEIGIRRAIGATPTAIVGQILIESIVLTLIAGVAGLMSGVGVLSLAGKLLEGREELIQNPQIDFGIAVGALVVLMIIGALAGLIPANRAVRIKAIEAIREE